MKNDYIRLEVKGEVRESSDIRRGGRFVVLDHMEDLGFETGDVLVFHPGPIPMIMHCPQCNQRHIDEGEFSTKPHHTHACQVCGMVWRPAIVPTVGVAFLPGFKNG